MISDWMPEIGVIVIILSAVAFAASRMLVVRIQEHEVGIVIKKWGNASLPAHRLVALNGEAGLQADTLAPGRHWFYWSPKYKILKVPTVWVPPGELALVIAEDGDRLPEGQLLGRVVIECDQFQDARTFLLRGGQKGRQRAVLTTGRYRINTALFRVVTSRTATDHGLKPDDLRVYTVSADSIGIVTTSEGASLPPGDIAGPPIAGHEDFQNIQKFIEGGGYKGLQEAFLTAGAWNLNPWFVTVEQAPLTTIPTGTVGVVVSYVGKQVPEHIAGGQLVEPGYKGVWKTPLYPGRHPVNTKVMHVEIVPTHQITLDWSNDSAKPESNYDAQLHSLELLSKDGFAIEIAVTQVINIDGMNAAIMISRIGSPRARGLTPRIADSAGGFKFDSIRNLVTRVLSPMIDNHFRHSAQHYEALDFLEHRSDRQEDAIAHIAAALRDYGVQSVGTFISKISLPPQLMEILANRKLAEEEQKTYEKQKDKERTRKELAYLQHLSDSQKDIVTHEQQVKIADLERQAKQIVAEAEAASIRTVGEAQLEVMRANMEALGPEKYLELEKLKHLATVKLPETLVSGAIGLDSPLDALVLQMLKRFTGAQQPGNPPGGSPERAATTRDGK